MFRVVWRYFAGMLLVISAICFADSYLDRFSDEQILTLYRLFDRYHTEEYIIQHAEEDVMKDPAVPQDQKQSEIERIKAKSQRYRDIFLDSLIQIGGKDVLKHEEEIRQRAQDILAKNYAESQGNFDNNANEIPDAAYETQEQYNRLVEFEDRTLAELDSINQLIENAPDDSTRERLIAERDRMLKRHKIEGLKLKLEIAKEMGDEERVKFLEELIRKETAK